MLLKIIAMQGRPDLLQTLTHSLFIAVFGALAAQSLVWQRALKRYPLNVAYTWRAPLFR